MGLHERGHIVSKGFGAFQDCVEYQTAGHSNDFSFNTQYVLLIGTDAGQTAGYCSPPLSTDIINDHLASLTHMQPTHRQIQAEQKQYSTTEHFHINNSQRCSLFTSRQKRSPMRSPRSPSTKPLMFTQLRTVVLHSEWKDPTTKTSSRRSTAPRRLLTRTG